MERGIRFIGNGQAPVNQVNPGILREAEIEGYKQLIGNKGE